MIVAKHSLETFFITELIKEENNMYAWDFVFFQKQAIYQEFLMHDNYFCVKKITLNLIKRVYGHYSNLLLI